MTLLVNRLRNIASAKSRPMDRASCIETEAADEIERAREFAIAMSRYAMHWDECRPGNTGECVCGLQSLINELSGHRPAISKDNGA